ncbi:MAG: hypothetical protein R6U19_10740 [Bacteroidales bacterium]
MRLLGTHITLLFIPVLLVLLFTDQASAQEDREGGGMQKGWIVGLQTGVYFANSHTANYYNGREGNVNEISFILDNKYHRDDILNYYEAYDYVYDQSDLPREMHYEAAMNIGFLARNNITKNWGVFLNFNFVRLRTKGSFILEIDPDQIISEPNEHIFPIYGEEERHNINIGIHRQFNLLSPSLTYYGELGVNFNNTIVEESSIEIAGNNYSIIDRYGGGQGYQPGVPQTEYDLRLGGVGLGFFGGMGFKFLFSDKLTLDVGLTSYVKYINLEHYKSFNVHWAPYTRLMYNGFFDFL